MADHSYLAAYITLMGLESAMPHSSGLEDRMILLPGTDTLTIEEAAARLSRSDIHVSCRAMVEDHVLKVSCDRLKPHDIDRLQRDASIKLQRWLNYLNQKELPPDIAEQPIVVVRNSFRSLKVPLGAIIEWLSSHDFRNPGSGYSLLRPTVSEAGAGIGLVLQFDYDNATENIILELEDDDAGNEHLKNNKQS